MDIFKTGGVILERQTFESVNQGGHLDRDRVNPVYSRQ